MENLIATALYGLASEERLRAVQRMCEVAERLGDESTWFHALFSTATVHLARQEISSCMELFRRCEPLAERIGNREGSLSVQHFLAMGALRSGDLVEASSRLDDLMNRLEPKDLPATELINSWPTAPAHSASARLALGRPDEALRLRAEALRRAGELGQAPTSVMVLQMSALLQQIAHGLRDFGSKFAAVRLHADDCPERATGPIKQYIGTPSEALSTRCGGQRVVVFYGMAKPVRAPQIGPPREP